jgi:hypothetical protein
VDALDAIRSRRSVREFSSDAVNDTVVEKILGAHDSCELMAVIAVGRPKKTSGKGSRKTLEELVL